MYEKISDRSVRVKKVELIRQKILSEIINLLSSVNDIIKYVENAECRESAILKGSALLHLRGYVESNSFLMKFREEHYYKDAVLYDVSIDTINMMVSNWLGKNIAKRWVDAVDECGAYSSLDDFLCDEYFEHRLYSILERSMYESGVESN